MTSHSPFGKLGAWLRKLRLQAGYPTQRAWLDALSKEGVIYVDSFWSKVERGKRRPRRDYLLIIMKFLHKKGLLTMREAQEIMRLAGYASLNLEEVSFVFGSISLPRVVQVHVSASTLDIYFCDGRLLVVPLNQLPSLEKLSPQARSYVEIRMGESSQVLYWPEADVRVSIAEILWGFECT